MDLENEALLTYTSALQNAVDKTFSFNNQTSLFCALSPAYMRDYATRYVLPACQWVDGYVPEIHGSGFGVIATRTASALISGLAKQVVGERPIFRSSAPTQDQEEDLVSYCYKLSRDGNFKKAIYGAVGFAMTAGTSLIKLNIDDEGNPWWESFRLDSTYFRTDFRGRVREAYFYINSYADSTSDDRYYIVERRFYWTVDKLKVFYNAINNKYTLALPKGTRVPMASYNVFKSSSKMLSRTDYMGKGSGIPWEQLPQWLRKDIQEDYGTMKIGVPKYLPISNLGVEICKDGEIDISIPTAQNFGKSKILDVQSDLINYEFANTYRLRDAYLGKGTLYIPKNMSMADTMGGAIAKNGNIYSAMPETPVQMMRGVDPESQQAIVKQFNLRVVEWQKMMDDSLKAIATKWGTTPKALSSYLSQGEAQQTATQIDSEDDMSIAFINQERSYFYEPFNRLLATTLELVGKPNAVELTFGNPSLVNKDRLLARTEKEYAMGLIDIEDAVRQTNPDLEEDALRVKIAKAKARQEEMKEQLNLNDLNSNEALFEDEPSKPHNNLKDGADVEQLFKDNEEDTGGNNLKGTTNPTQKQGYTNLFD
jgi:hypothetical protein